MIFVKSLIRKLKVKQKAFVDSKKRRNQNSKMSDSEIIPRMLGFQLELTKRLNIIIEK